MSRALIKSRSLWIALLAAALAGTGAPAGAQLPPEPSTVAQVPAHPSPHWVWINDMNFDSLPDGKAYLVDGDTGRMLGMLSTGYSFNAVILPGHPGVIYSPETYYSLGTRGTRTDVVTVYDAVHLTPVAEIAIPPKRSSNLPMAAAAALTDDDRFLLIYNFTPAQSVTVVDTAARRLAGEIGIPGCALVYPTGPRSFFSICSDGSLLLTRLTDDGKAASRIHTARLFDPMKDLLTEKGVRLGDTWLFASFGGTMYPLRSTSHGIELGPTWPLFTPRELAGHWRTGGLQHLALQRQTGRLYAIVHQGGLETHKDPGERVWVYDVASHRKVQEIHLRHPATSIQISQDPRPLLFACSLDSETLDIYDGSSGRYLRSVPDLGATPTVLVTP
jgi:methylamine dehydrogenase heavy chain